MRLALLLLVASAVPAAEVWTVRVEEPTGLYPRDRETVAVPFARLANHRAGFTVTDDKGRELPWQAGATELLFPASLIPGELPAYKISCCSAARTDFPNPILLRRIGQSRVEFGNPHFRAVIDLEAGAFVEAYNLRAAPQRILNLVETIPEGPDALQGDVHESTPQAKRFSPPPVPGVDGPNSGWTTLGGSGRFIGVELLESGALRGRLRLARAGEAWEIEWTANGAWFRWKATRGFRFAAISAAPYVPFNRCLDGSEYAWPTGPGEDEPTPNLVALRDWAKLPGGHMVYYQREENYGALGIVALDAALTWRGAGTRRFIGDKAEGASEIAVTFPAWRGAETVLVARQENRIVRQPLLVRVTGPETARAVVITAPAVRVAEVTRTNRAPTAFRADALPLDGEWELAFAEKGQGPPESGWRTVKVPGSVHMQWLAPSQVFTREAEWVSGKEWWYRKRFTAPARFRDKRVRLEFEATDYYADTWLNGVSLGRHEGYIDPFAYDTGAALRAGSENILLVRVWTPVSYYWKHRPYTIKGAYGAVDQKPDDITALGITRSVRLAAYQSAVIRDVAVNTRLVGSGAVVEVDLESDRPFTGHRWEVTLTPRNFSSPERYQARVAAEAGRVTIPLDSPHLWWTRDHGAPNLYTLDVRLLDAQGAALDARSQAVGIREIEKIGWDFYLNRRKMFIRGTNYYYHLFLSEMDRAKYERDLDLMLGMNVNMIRLHCHFTNREFYDLADEKGVLIWQDFLEAWYPHDRRFALRAAELYDNHVRYARNHSSVALWATSDEEDFENYHEITKHLAPRPSLLDPQRRPVVRSTGRFGDSHVYHGWYDGTIWEYTQMTERFVSELGATSLPNFQTLIQFMPNHWPIKDHAEEWTWRRLQIPEAMKAWGDPEGLTLEQYVPRTQAFVARLFQIAIERMRRRKAEGAGGILHFHAIDIWPSVTMAAIDFNRVPTKTYDTVRRSFEPVAALFEYDRDRWKPGETFRCKLWAVNDRWDPVPGASLRWQVTGPVSALPQGSAPVSLRADSVAPVTQVEFAAAMAGAYQLRAGIVDAQGRTISENIFEFEVKK
jgi:beta-mannosidase